jgi:hypothetical protein
MTESAMKHGAKATNNGAMVVVSPKLVGEFYYRIVSHPGGTYRVERYDPKQGYWTPAPKNVRFNDVCNAPQPSDWLQNLLRRAAPMKGPDAA